MVILFMDYLLFFLKGLLIGLIVGFPSGPVGFIYIKRATTDGFWAGFISGLGSTTAHVFYVVAILFGYVKMLEEFGEHKDYLTFACALFLIILGFIILKTKEQNRIEKITNTGPKSMFGYFISALGITATNPMEIVQFTFLFPILCVFTQVPSEYILLISGITIGSLFWPVIISLYMDKMGHTLSPRKINYIQKLTGLVIIVIGVIFIVKGLV